MSRYRFWTLVIGFTVLLWGLVYGLGFEVVRVRSVSMQPAIEPGQLLLVNRLAYGVRLAWMSDWLVDWDEPQRGDVVVFLSPVDGKRLIKRVQAVPGDAHNQGIVPSGHYLLVGDNAAKSHDSRQFGLVVRSAIIGQVMLVAPSPASGSVG